jgi:hypothetical protein
MIDDARLEEILIEVEVDDFKSARIGDPREFVKRVARRAVAEALAEAAELSCFWCKEGYPFREDPGYLMPPRTWHRQPDDPMSYRCSDASIAIRALAEKVK